VPFLEEVFKLSGVPTITFVEPAEYDALKVSIRTPGRCSVIEGPSGIGKTSSVIKIIQELGIVHEALQLSGRKPEDVALIEALPAMQDIGIVIVDDFHRLSAETKDAIAQFMKTLADEEHESSKLVVIGINKAGDHLVTFGHDIGLRIDVFKMEANPDNKIEELINKGEAALNVKFYDKDNFIDRSIGSFQIAQILSYTQCIKNQVSDTLITPRVLSTSVEVIVDDVIQDLRRIFFKPTISFARGSKLRREGRAPYLHILRWLAQASDWSLDLRQEVRVRPEHRGSVGQVVEKGYLATLLADKSDVLGEFFHFDEDTSVISAEDPRLIFYLKNLNWRAFAKDVGFSSQEFKGRYDFALSFAGEERNIAQRLCQLLSEREISVLNGTASPWGAAASPEGRW
jgi:ATPase family associated with various cellular activities (AAA)